MRSKRWAPTQLIIDSPQSSLDLHATSRLSGHARMDLPITEAADLYDGKPCRSSLDTLFESRNLRFIGLSTHASRRGSRRQHSTENEKTRPSSSYGTLPVQIAPCPRSATICMAETPFRLGGKVNRVDAGAVCPNVVPLGAGEQREGPLSMPCAQGMELTRLVWATRQPRGRRSRRQGKTRIGAWARHAPA
jgi:hypothetical protein